MLTVQLLKVSLTCACFVYTNQVQSHRVLSNYGSQRSSPFNDPRFPSFFTEIHPQTQFSDHNNFLRGAGLSTMQRVLSPQLIPPPVVSPPLFNVPPPSNPHSFGSSLHNGQNMNFFIPDNGIQHSRVPAYTSSRYGSSMSPLRHQHQNNQQSQFRPSLQNDIQNIKGASLSEIKEHKFNHVFHNHIKSSQPFSLQENDSKFEQKNTKSKIKFDGFSVLKKSSVITDKNLMNQIVNRTQQNKILEPLNTNSNQIKPLSPEDLQLSENIKSFFSNPDTLKRLKLFLSSNYFVTEEPTASTNAANLLNSTIEQVAKSVTAQVPFTNLNGKQSDFKTTLNDNHSYVNYKFETATTRSLQETQPAFIPEITNSQYHIKESTTEASLILQTPTNDLDFTNFLLTFPTTFRPLYSLPQQILKQTLEEKSANNTVAHSLQRQKTATPKKTSYLQKTNPTTAFQANQNTQTLFNTLLSLNNAKPTIFTTVRPSREPQLTRAVVTPSTNNLLSFVATQPPRKLATVTLSTLFNDHFSALVNKKSPKITYIPPATTDYKQKSISKLTSTTSSLSSSQSSSSSKQLSSVSTFPFREVSPSSSTPRDFSPFATGRSKAPAIPIKLGKSLRTFDDKPERNKEKSEASYTFEYQLTDPRSGIQYGHGESRLGNQTVGKYTVPLANGKLQVVRYSVDEFGAYRANITYEKAGTK